MSELWVVVLIVAGGLLVEAFFSGSEIALLACDKLRLRQKAESGSRGAALLQRMLERPQHLFGITLVGTNLAVITSTTVVTLALVEAYGPDGDTWTIFIMSPLVLLFGEIVPKTWFRARADVMAPRVVRTLWVFSYVFMPLTSSVARLTEFILRLLHVEEGSRRAFVTREDLQMLMRLQPSGGQLAAAERRMINRIFQFAAKPVREVMIQLSDVAAVEQSEPPERAVALVRERGFSRLPVYAQRIDDVRGILHSFDLLSAREGAVTVAAFMRPTLYVPESQRVDELLGRMRREGHGMAVVVDEYGGAVGVVTVEDLLEEIVGEIEDEHDPRRAGYRRLGPERYAVAARMSLEEVNTVFGLAIPRGDYQTVAGFLLDRLRRLPREGERLRVPGASLLVSRASDRAILEVQLELDAGGRPKARPPGS